MKTAFLSVGSNMGDRARNIVQALEALASQGSRVVKQSSLYETEPVELREQDWFLNCVVEIETNLRPRELMQVLLRIERSMGRERTVPKGPRVMDLDILLFGSESVHESHLEIPHPRMADRRFVLVPLTEIAPETVHPVMRKTIQQLLEDTPDHSEVRRA